MEEDEELNGYPIFFLVWISWRQEEEEGEEMLGMLAARAQHRGRLSERRSGGLNRGKEKATIGTPYDDDMGNSEVGHNALGAGRIYAQGAKLVDLALETGKIYEGEGFKYIQQCFENGTLHLIGLLSDGGVHSRLNQLQLLLKGCAEHGAKRIRVNILTDGRDVVDGTSVKFAEILENDRAQLREQGVDAQIASGGGRMYVTMDRYEVGFDLCFMLKGEEVHETVKFGHVTFFWNGNRSGYFNPEVEEYVEIPSDVGISFNVQPKMKVSEIAEKARDAILSRKFDQVHVNIPNGDMVGHTGDSQATIVGCEAGDEAVKLLSFEILAFLL
ncbi:hypothetical protein Cgig2_004586 [Carnegiea gigantea]|uniref:phosphoglycerate mutase (2,3-diphosphoglycerate-independent) n=1 Tax=Carnegiea gigantea TaxID=171969 RepID=A0A9Q1Q8J5_9CARY|nr:hypothetical protein Cgig2_004586 [Carnegiea gigantea]